MTVTPGSQLPQGFATRAIHAGQEPDAATGAVTVPIYQTSTFAQEAVGVHKGYEYARTGNPTRTAYETAMASLEGGAWGLAFASGMAATASLLYTLSSGDHVVAGNDLYGGTYRLFDKVLSRYGLEFDFVDTTDTNAVAHALSARTRMVWLETPTNPMLGIIDIAAVVDAVRSKSPAALVVVDNTFASPFLQQPLALGADLAVHSATKYLGGHSDLVGGVVIGKDPAFGKELAFIQNAAGAVPGPFDAWLALRGLKTLALRMGRHCESGLAIAQWLEGRRGVERVLYPGLPDHPGHALAARQMPLGFGGMVSFILEGGTESAKRVVSAARLFILAESLGGVESLIEQPAEMTHLSVAGSALEVPGGLVRLSVGIEDLVDLIADLEQALDAA